MELEYPRDGDVLSDFICGAFISGHAAAASGPRFDVAIALDTSRSTIDPSGADIDGDGLVGASASTGGALFHAESSDPDDSILAAEVAAARELVRQFDARVTRVALVEFSGDPRAAAGGRLAAAAAPAATLLVPLGADFSQLEAALDELLRRDPLGATHMAAGLDRAVGSLADPVGESPVTERQKVVFFFTDGQPTLPHGPGFEAENVREVLLAVQRARAADVRIHSFAIGAEALEGPLAVVEMARQTNGYFVPVRAPGDLVRAVGEVSVARLSEILVTNRTTGEEATLLRLRSDGAWGGFVPLAPGDNAIEIVARADDGVESLRNLTLRYEEEAPPNEIPPDVASLRNTLLQDCLANLKRLNLELERERDARVRRQLRVEIERERRAARRRAAAQRKRLEIALDPSTVPQ